MYLPNRGRFCAFRLAWAGAAVFGAAGVLLLALEARAESWLDGPRYGRIGLPPAAVRPALRQSEPLNAESRRYALEHGFQVIELNPPAFPSSRGDMFNYQPSAMIYVPPAPGTSDAGHGRRSIAPNAVFLHPNYSMYGTYSRRFGRQPLTGPLRPTESLLEGATPRILHFESRRRR